MLRMAGTNGKMRLRPGIEVQVIGVGKLLLSINSLEGAPVGSLLP